MGFRSWINTPRGWRRWHPLLLSSHPPPLSFLKPDGSPLAAGDIIKQPDLAASYRSIAADGIGWFYGGPFAQAVEKWMSANGGILTAADFAGYQMKLREPLITQYRGYTIIGFPPPSSGGVHVAEILNIINHFDIAALAEARIRCCACM